MRYYCTYFDRNYLIKALNLFNSLEMHESQPYTIIAVCLDEISRALLTKLQLPNVQLFALHELEFGHEKLLAAKLNRSIVEYYWTLTPQIIKKIFRNNQEIDQITYIDSDCYFFSDPQPIYDEFDGNSVLIHGHRFSQELQYLERNGKYNVGLLVFKNDLNGNAVLDWWGDRCIEWCYAETQDGKFGDQKYLDEWERLFNGVRVLEHIGAGLAPWNHIQYHYELTKNGISVDEKPVIFYHYHSLSSPGEALIIPMKFRAYKANRFLIDNIYLPYIDAFRKNLLMLRTLLPGFSFGVMDKTTITEELMFFSLSPYRHEILTSKLPHRLRTLNGDWDCFFTDQIIEQE